MIMDLSINQESERRLREIGGVRSAFRSPSRRVSGGAVKARGSV